MIGYWKNGFKPIFTTGDNFLSNFKFLVPGRLGIFLLVIPFFLIQSALFPSYEYVYKGSAYDDYVKITYTGTSDIEGHISWLYYDTNPTTGYKTLNTMESDFKGTMVNNELTVTLADPNIRTYGHTLTLNTTQVLHLNDSQLTFHNITTTGGRTF